VGGERERERERERVRAINRKKEKKKGKRRRTPPTAERVSKKDETPNAQSGASPVCVYLNL
jgi:hypothetical protein